MHLFSTFQLGPIELNNRVVMAPMTRSRALGGTPNDLMRDYYAARASAGLIITEGIAPSRHGLGYARIPGLFSDEQVEGFRAVTDAVHRRGGRIFAQLMHVGRIAHPLNMPQDAQIVAPSAIRAEGTMWTDQGGPQPHPVPDALTREGIVRTRREFVKAAQSAIRDGFDGVELHAANGYLLNQFLHPRVNVRDDEYGGSVANRARFLLEVVRETAEAIGASRLGVRLSPHGTFNDLPEIEGEEEQYVEVARGLRGLAYLHLIRNPNPLFASTFETVRTTFGGTVIINGGFDRPGAEEMLSRGQAELVSFGRPFIANPDLVERLRRGVELAQPDPSTFYSPGPEGYVDYPEAS